MVRIFTCEISSYLCTFYALLYTLLYMCSLIRRAHVLIFGTHMPSYSQLCENSHALACFAVARWPLLVVLHGKAWVSSLFPCSRWLDPFFFFFFSIVCLLA
ncbi:hypothetical protein L873DRAFT_858689 [Choiromyces venosus 120613-1]|uniref:Uncharacterized protein n=1 Tax=Choiromyces venosus 120613-1 TaxID=1336337 RepID=A0A3N4ITT0_9PEZI|nr:hypothetical protein L873DRAFT_858689 [Choiromyces venosus 120613-1]